MTNAAAAKEYRSNIGHDYSMADAFDAEYLDEEAKQSEPRDPRRDEEAAPLIVRRPKVERCGVFFI